MESPTEKATKEEIKLRKIYERRIYKAFFSRGNRGYNRERITEAIREFKKSKPSPGQEGKLLLFYAETGVEFYKIIDFEYCPLHGQLARAYKKALELLHKAERLDQTFLRATAILDACEKDNGTFYDNLRMIWLNFFDWENHPKFESNILKAPTNAKK